MMPIEIYLKRPIWPNIQILFLIFYLYFPISFYFLFSFLCKSLEKHFEPCDLIELNLH